jgi:hypothetical protein
MYGLQLARFELDLAVSVVRNTIADLAHYKNTEVVVQRDGTPLDLASVVAMTEQLDPKQSRDQQHSTVACSVVATICWLGHLT